MSSIHSQRDRQVWDRVLAGDVTAFQSVVESHQAAVSAVAYAIVGDFPASQDIAQETFWVAWSKKNSLRDVPRLGAWLCGIARNLARQWRRKNRHRTGLDHDFLTQEATADSVDPARESIAREERQLVWQALQEIPENYREVLTLYYRQGQSIADVAAFLGITEVAARQRLSRGREMLRGKVAQLVEGVLVRSRPDKSFAARVIAGLAGAGVASTSRSAAASSLTAGKSAAAGAAVVKGTLAAGTSAGLLGGLLGTMGGLGGGFLGTWIPAQLAPTETERQLLLHQARTTLGLAIVYSVAVFGLSLSFVLLKFPLLYFLVALAALSAAFAVTLTWRTIRLAALVNRLRQELPPQDDPNQSALAHYAHRSGKQPVRTARSFTSDAMLFGYPLVDIQFRAIDPGKPAAASDRAPTARGWIAIGDRAQGILVAAGGVAKGFLAFGGLAVGIISCGGVSVGLLSLGGVSLGLIAIGGLALGHESAGGLALGWHSAAGGAAIAWHAAMGGLAVAREYAVGGGAFAANANTPAAQQVIQQDTLAFLIEWLNRNQLAFMVGVIAFSVVPALAMKWLFNRLDQETSGVD
jgi:RNA polymerase sigma factor (sigma-70 family)